MAEKRKDNKGRILAKGESQRKDGLYQYRFVDTDGARKTIYASNLKQLREREAAVTACLYSGGLFKSGITGRDLLSRYIRHKEMQVDKGRVKRSTLLSLRAMVNSVIEDSIFAQPIEKIRVADAKEWVQYRVSCSGDKDSTTKLKVSIVRRAFDTAVEDELINRNPFIFKNDLIGDTHSQVKGLSHEDQIGFVGFLVNQKQQYYADIVTILIGTGMRISEMLAITIDDVDFNGMNVDVSKQIVNERNGARYISTPKTKAGVRKIPISQKTLDAFGRVIRRSKEYHIPPLDGRTGFIFVSYRGVMSRNTVQETLKHYEAKYNREYSKNVRITPHVFRHTFCTNLSENNIHPKAIQYVMGHASTDTSSIVYDHVDYERANISMRNI